MVKSLQIYSEDPSIKKRAVHSLISLLKSHLHLSIDFLSVNFISSSEIKQINKKYLKHNYETDIITFNYSNNKNKLDAEILISFEEARRNAKIFRVNYDKEILRLIIHGILHLIGFNDNSKKNKFKMKSMENKLINKFNFILLAGREDEV